MSRETPWEKALRTQINDAQELERRALVENARLRGWLREFASQAGPDAMRVAERVLTSDTWVRGREEVELARPESHGARRTGGLR